MADPRVTRQAVEVAASDPSPERALRVSRQATEVAASDPDQGKLRVTRQAVEAMASDPSPERGLRVTRQTVEVLAKQPDGTFVSAGSILAVLQTASRNLVAGRSASSTLLPSGNASGGKLVACSASNNLGLIDAADASKAILAQASNPLILADQATGATALSAESSFALSHQAAATVAHPVAADSTLTLGHAADTTRTAVRSATNILGLVDNAGVNGVFFVGAVDTLALADQATGEITRFAHSNLALFGQATAALARSVSGHNALALNHTNQANCVLARSAGNALSIADTARASGSVVVSASHALSLGGQATVEIIRYAHSNLTLSHIATAAVAHAISATVALTLDSQAESSLSKVVSASNVLTLATSATGLAVPTIEVSAESQLWLWDLAEGRNSSIYVEGENDLDLDGGAHGNKVAHVAATTPIYFTEITLDRLTFDEIEVEHGIFGSASVYVYSDPEPTGNILSFGQRAGVVHVRADGISVTASNSLALSQWANPTPTGDAASQLTLGHSASATAGRVATSTLALDQQASRTVVRFVSAGSTLGLHQAVNVVLIKGCITRAYTPFVGSTDDPNAPAPPSTTVPTLERVEGVQLYWPVDSPTMTVTLRGPELDNKDRLRFQRINRETRGGTLVVFADPIWPKVQQLTLEFIGLEEDEAQSLLSFIAATLGKEVGLRDWENRHWAGVIVSPDEPIIRNGPHNIGTALEFEGVPA